ncbi:hypothetical protein [Chamaesiphon polymorphus]|nr:hypothetical protein [Chamaesiphon polymorphus]
MRQQRESLGLSTRSSEDLSHSEICDRYKLFGKDSNDRLLNLLTTVGENE